jgi:hypothetical protein
MRRAPWLSGLLVLAACGGVPADAGRDAWMMVSGAQFLAGAMPIATDGPPVASLDLSSNAARAGEIDKPLRGAVDPRATAAAIGLGGDRGYWIVPAGLADVAAPGYPTFDVTLSFSPELPAGPRDLVVRAVDATGRFGPPETRTLTVTGAPAPTGALVFSLRWDTEADLDLHVTAPDGSVIWKGDPSPPPGAALLDFDSNAGCVIDGRRQENVRWTSAPPSGHYQVRVDTFSLCAETFADWSVEARLAGKLVGHAAGESVETDADLPHDRGAGVLALELDVP